MIRKSTFAAGTSGVEVLEPRRLLSTQLLHTFDLSATRLLAVGDALYYTLGNREVHRIDPAGNVRSIRNPDAQRWNLSNNKPVLADAGGKAFLLGWTAGASSRPQVWALDARTHRGVPLLPQGMELEVDVAGTRPSPPVSAHGMLYFLAVDTATNRRSIWRSDGTAAGTRAFTTSSIVYPQNLAVSGGTIYFTASDGRGIHIYRSDGTQVGTRPMIGAPAVTGLPGVLVPAGSGVFYTQRSLTYSESLWFSDGTEAGTRRVGGPFGGAIGHLTPVGSRAYFTATSEHGNEVWVSDGTTVGTRRLTDLAPGPVSGISGFGVKQFFASGDSLVFSTGASYFHLSGDLWKIGPDDKPLKLGTSPQSIAVHGDRVYYGHGYYRVSDGAQMQGSMLWLGATDIAAGDDLVYFSTQKQIWRTDRRLGAVEGIIFNDINGNGVHERGEWEYLPGFRVFVDLNNDGRYNSGEPMARSNTLNGGYYIGGLQPGQYTVRMTEVGGYRATTPVARTAVVKPDRATNVHFGNRPGGATVSGTIFRDDNASGTQDAGEAGVAGFRVYFDRNQNGRWDRDERFVRTDAHGRYRFDDVTLQHHLLRVTEVAGWRATGEPSARFHPTPLQQINQPFGVTQNLLIRGSVTDFSGLGGLAAGWRVYVDLDDNDQHEPNEPAAMTGEDGTFVIQSLAAGTYRLRLVMKENYRLLTPAQPYVMLSGASAQTLTPTFWVVPTGG